MGPLSAMERNEILRLCARENAHMRIRTKRRRISAREYSETVSTTSARDTEKGSAGDIGVHQPWFQIALLKDLDGIMSCNTRISRTEEGSEKGAAFSGARNKSTLPAKVFGKEICCQMR